MTSTFRYSFVSMWLLVGCSGPADVRTEPDAPPDPDAGDAPPPSSDGFRLLVTRGEAGIEDLVYVTPDGEQMLSIPGGRPLCEGRVFCDLPPNPSATRFPVFDFVGSAHAVFLDASEPAIYSVDLATGARTLLSGAIPWGDISDTRAAWVYDYARIGSVTFWSLVTEDAYKLYRSDGPGEPLRSLAARRFRAGETPRETHVTATHDALAWTVGTTVVDGELIDFVTAHTLLAHDGTERTAPTIVPAGGGACIGPALLASPTFAYSYYPAGGTCADPRTLVVDVATGAARHLDSASGGHAAGLSPDGRLLYANENVGGALAVTAHDVASATLLGSVTGQLSSVGATGELLLKHPSPSASDGDLHGVSPALRVIDVTTTDPGFLALAGTGVGLGDSPYGEPRDTGFLPDGRVFAVAGSPSPKGCANVGLRVYGPTDRVDVEPAACRDDLVRQPQLDREGRWLVYLDDAAGSLDVVAYEIATGARVRLTTPTAHERGFVLR